ncbi:MAG: hypothetical protein LUD72_10330 [Bacteroidales bacterium]|nr:hypothetical protein [Bacteroidales bacterium]
MEEITITNVERGIDSEICAAIAMALSLEGIATEEHDSESFTLTIQQQDTPWNSHQRTLRQMPKRK